MALRVVQRCFHGVFSREFALEGPHSRGGEGDSRGKDLWVLPIWVPGFVCELGDQLEVEGLSIRLGVVVSRMEDLCDVLQQWVWIRVLLRPARDRPHDLVCERGCQSQELLAWPRRRQVWPGGHTAPGWFAPPITEWPGLEGHLKAHQRILERKVLGDGIELGAVQTVLVRHVSAPVAGMVAALAAVLPCVRPAMALAALLAREGVLPLGPSSQDLLGRVVVLVQGVLLGGFGWDVEDLGDGLSQAYHHLVRVAAKVTGLEVPQGLVPRVVAS